jgi:hypothetical protein
VGQRANFAATTYLRGREVKALGISSRNGTMRIIAAYERRRQGCGVGKACTGRGCRPLMGAPGALSFAANRAFWTRTNPMGMLRRNGMRVLPSSRLFWHPKSVKYFLSADKGAFRLTKSISHQITSGGFIRLQWFSGCTD